MQVSHRFRLFHLFFRPDYLPLGLLGRFVTNENETKLNLIDVKLVFLPLTEFCWVPSKLAGLLKIDKP